MQNWAFLHLNYLFHRWNGTATTETECSKRILPFAIIFIESFILIFSLHNLFCLWHKIMAKPNCFHWCNSVNMSINCIKRNAFSLYIFKTINSNNNTVLEQKRYKKHYQEYTQKYTIIASSKLTYSSTESFFYLDFLPQFVTAVNFCSKKNIRIVYKIFDICKPMECLIVCNEKMARNRRK